MKRMLRPWLQMLLIVTLLGSLLPMNMASAAARIEINGLYKYNTTTDNAIPPDDTLITTVTSSRINLRATMQDLTDAQIRNIYIEIKNMVTGQTTEERSVVPQRVPNTLYDYEFTGVPLTEGLNRIKIMLSGTSTLESVEAWVYYTPVTNIRNLLVNGLPWEEDRFYPPNPDEDTLVILTGEAPNSTAIDAYMNGSSTAIPGFTGQDDEFSFTGDDINGGSSTADLYLTPGDNLLKLISYNSSRTYQVERNLIYDNGQPFVYGAEINETAPADDDDGVERLILSPVVVDDNVTIYAKLKVDLDDDGELLYDSVRISVTDLPDYVIDLETSAFIAGTGTVTTSVYAADYQIYDVEISPTLNTSRSQSLEFVFSNGIAADDVQSSFTFTYENPALPYVDHVEMSVGNGASIRISDAPYETEVNQQPVSFYVFTGEAAGQVVSVDVPGRTYGNQTTDVNGVATFTFSDLPIGEYDITFTPAGNAGGSRTYSLTVSSAPYVIFQNIYNGLILDENDMVSGYDVTARAVNVPSKDYMRVEVNNVAFDNTALTFTGNILSFEVDDYDPATPNVPGFAEGRNTIKVTVYSNTARTIPVTEATVEVFLFREDVPEFLNIEPVEEEPRVDLYRATNILDSYVTNEDEVAFTGRLYNATTVTVTVMGSDDDDGTYTYSTSPDTSTPSDSADRVFTTGSFELPETGDATFEFTITNASNIQVSRVLTITRENLPYILKQPIFTENAEGIYQANINANFVEIEIEANGADAVLFDDEPAVETEDGLFVYEVLNLKQGDNDIEFTVIRGTEEIEAEVVVYNVNTTIEGAQNKSAIKNRLRLFNNQVDLTFPRDTKLRRNNTEAVNQFITPERQILFGIASDYDGRVDKYKHPTSYDRNNDSPYSSITSTANVGRSRLARPERFSPASPLYWFDAGTIDDDDIEDTTDLNEALRGSGQLPYEEEEFFNRDVEDLVIPTQAGELTLSYDPVIRNDGWKYVTVYHFDYYEDYLGREGWRWRNIGGTVDPDDNTITVPFERFGYYQVMYMDRSFNDVIDHPWARDDLDILYSKGIMLNKESSNFRPNDPISRGEFVTLLVKVFDIPLQYTDDATFSDVLRVNPLSNGLYDYMHIETAARAGIIRGAGGGRFQPDSSITRQDAAVMIARAGDLDLNTNSARVLTSLQREFTDANLIDVYARASVEAVFDEEFIVGKENVLLQGQRKATYRFDPTANFTRAEAAAVIIRIMAENDKIPN